LINKIENHYQKAALKPIKAFMYSKNLKLLWSRGCLRNKPWRCCG